MTDPTTALAPTSAPLSLVRNYTEAKSFAQAYALSGLRSGSKGDHAQRTAEALVKIEAGAELGIGPMAAIQAFHVVEGKPTMSGNGWAALIRRSGRYDYRIAELTPKRCSLEFLDRGEAVYTSTFTIDDAKAAGLAGKSVWKSYPEDMLFNRAITKGARKICPDVAMGLPIYTPEEIENVTEEPTAAPREPAPVVDAAYEEVPEIERTEEVERPAGLAPRSAKPSQVEALIVAIGEVDACATDAALGEWSHGNAERVGAFSDKGAALIEAFVDGIAAMRRKEPWDPVDPADSALFNKACELAGLDHVNPSKPMAKAGA